MSERQTGITIDHFKHGNIVEETFGRLLSINENFWNATPGAIIKNPPEVRAKEILDAFGNEPWNGQLHVYLGHTPFIDQMRRLFDDNNRRIQGGLQKFVGFFSTLGAVAAGNLLRRDMYNPWNETLTLYNDTKAMALHKVSQAKLWDEAEHPGIKTLLYTLPFFGPVYEWKAAHNALAKLDNEKDRKDFSKVIEPYWGRQLLGGRGMATAWTLFATPFAPFTQLFTSALIGGPGAIAGWIHSRISNNSVFETSAEKKKRLNK
jgi:hypothetical protein